MPPKKKSTKKQTSLIDSPALVPDEDARPLRIPQIDSYKSDPVLRPLLNRTATDLERGHILKIINRQTSSFNQLESSINAASITRDESYAIVENLRHFLMVARSHQVIIQRRLDSQTSLKAEVSFTKQIIREDKDIDEDLSEVLVEFNKELDILHEAFEKDLDGLAKVTLRIQKLEKNVVEACLKTQLESDSLCSFQYRRALISGIIRRYEALLILPAFVPHKDLIPVEDPEPSEIPLVDSYKCELALLSLSNRTATDVERKHILEMIQRQTSSFNQLEDPIKQGIIACDESRATLDNFELLLMAARSHRVIIQRRLDSQKNIETEASFTERVILQKKKVSDDGQHEVLLEFHEELATVRETIKRDLQALEEMILRIGELKKDVVEASLVLQLETDSLKSSKRCQTIICNTIRRYRSLLNRGRGLPSEILTKIFGFMVDSDINLIRSNPDKSRSFAVLRLSSICRYWRQIVHQTPCLWQYIPLPSSRDAKHLEVFCLYAQNSVGTPHITIHFSPKKSESAPVTFGAHGKFGAYAGLGVFSTPTSGPNTTLPDTLSYYLDTTIPHIAEALSKTLLIEFIRRDSTSEVDCKWPITSYTLRHYIPKFTELTSTQVSKLIIHTGNVSNEQVRGLCATLRNLPKLQYLGIYVGRFVIQGNWQGIVNLESLQILSTQLKFVEELFGTLIVAPKLRCLHISGGNDQMAIQPENWQRIVSQAKLGAIRKVVLESSTSAASTATGLLSILEGLVAIETLDLIGNFLSPIVSALTTRSLLSPALRTLVIRDSDIDGSILKQLIQSRRDTIEGEAVGKSIINKVELDGSSKIELACCDEIREMVDTLLVTDRCYFAH